jgi:hypothetical protein
MSYETFNQVIWGVKLSLNDARSIYKSFYEQDIEIPVPVINDMEAVLTVGFWDGRTDSPYFHDWRYAEHFFGVILSSQKDFNIAEMCRHPEQYCPHAITYYNEHIAPFLKTQINCLESPNTWFISHVS